MANAQPRCGGDEGLGDAPRTGMRGSPAAPACRALNDLMMPVTVPSRPSSGEILAIVPNVLRKRSRSCTTCRPASSSRSIMDFAAAVPAGQPGGQHAPQGRVLLQGCDHLVSDLIGLHQLAYTADEVPRQHSLLLQRPQTLENNGCRSYGAQDDRPHERAAGPYDFPHPIASPRRRQIRVTSYRTVPRAQGGSARVATRCRASGSRSSCRTRTRSWSVGRCGCSGPRISDPKLWTPAPTRGHRRVRRRAGPSASCHCRCICRWLRWWPSPGESIFRPSSPRRCWSIR